MPARDCIERHPFGVELDGPHRRKGRPLRFLALLGLVIVAVLLAAHFRSF